MEKITLSLTALQEKLAQMQNDNVQFVELHFILAQKDGNLLFPAFLQFDGIAENGQYRDYESIDEFCSQDYEDNHKTA
ncbi:MAG: hypothetical protein GX424_05290 [Clostridiales bacterium]|nr:hypothetical protein [Clostridiales bacterium]